MRYGTSHDYCGQERKNAVNMTGVQAIWVALGIHSQGTKPVWDWGKGWPDLGPDIVSHLKPVVMTCKY